MVNALGSIPRARIERERERKRERKEERMKEGRKEGRRKKIGQQCIHCYHCF
jgi:hypothetical protein